MYQALTSVIQFSGPILLLAAVPLQEQGPATVLWTAPCILLASVLIAWGAESAQFFVAQGFALAILALLQTLPEFAVEAVLAWKQQREFLLANLTGALRLLIGIGWPVIYFTAALTHRKYFREPLNRVKLHRHDSVGVIALALPIAYALFIWCKRDLHAYDAITLTACYVAYLIVLIKLPPQEAEQVDDLELVPRTIVKARPSVRNAAILACFIVGGALIFFTAEPFLGSVIAVATAIGVPSFVAIQWFAPVISEFPEIASTFYFARQEGKAATAMMNIVSSNINQWTLLTAMLPVILSFSVGQVSSIPLDDQQQIELLLTIGQSLVALIILLSMELIWWEILLLFVLFVVQFALSAIKPGSTGFGYLSAHIKEWITIAYFLWAAATGICMLAGRRRPRVFGCLRETWNEQFPSK